MKNIFTAIAKYIKKSHDFSVSFDYFYLLSIEFNSFGFSVFQIPNGRALIGFFYYYESVEARNKYIIQLAFCEITINGKVSK